LLLAISGAHSYHVLFVHTLGTRSHLITMRPLVEELLHRGHRVTAIFFQSLKLGHENYTEIVIPSMLEEVMEATSKKVMEKGGGNMMNPSIWLWMYNFYKERFADLALDVVTTEPVKQLIRERPKIDVLVNLSPGNAFFAQIFDCPIIMFSPSAPHSVILRGTTNVINNSIQPFPIAPFIEPMSFLTRLQNHAIVAMTDMFFDWMIESMFPHQQEFLWEELGVEVAHPAGTLLERVALLLASSHPITHGAWPHLPNLVEVGSLQLRPAGALPPDLQLFMDSATEGAVLVSFGSSLKADQMPEEKIQVFVDTFKQLDMKVIWKWDVELPGLPANVLLSSWLPQQDLLAHPNLKVFVTHGGLGGLVEAIYHKTAVVGLPLSNDQKPNLLRAERHGYAIVLNYEELTAEDLVAATRRAAGDPVLAARLERVHAIYTDRQAPPRVTAAWWVEYVSRHGVADWLRSPGAEAPFLQRHHLDLLLVLGLLLLAATIGTLLLCRAAGRRCRGGKAKLH
jgi:UDP:flavonoid glycosyltransferase YjiC (YdhE family)